MIDLIHERCRRPKGNTAAGASCSRSLVRFPLRPRPTSSRLPTRIRVDAGRPSRSALFDRRGRRASRRHMFRAVDMSRSTRAGYVAWVDEIFVSADVRGTWESERASWRASNSGPIGKEISAGWIGDRRRIWFYGTPRLCVQEPAITGDPAREGSDERVGECGRAEALRYRRRLATDD